MAPANSLALKWRALPSKTRKHPWRRDAIQTAILTARFFERRGDEFLFIAFFAGHCSSDELLRLGANEWIVS